MTPFCEQISNLEKDLPLFDENCENVRLVDTIQNYTLDTLSHDMKLAIFLFLLPTAAAAFSCGGKLTKPCLGEKDIRYDKKASNAFLDQAPVYRIAQGCYSCSQYLYDAMTGLPLEDGTSVGFPGGKVFPHKVFLNHTFDGS
jgi:hypothetical protein